ATPRVWPETIRCRWRRIPQESGYAVKYVTAFEKPAEYLIVQAVDPVAPELNVVSATNYRKTVANLRSPKSFVHVRGEKERVSKAERRKIIARKEALLHCRIGRDI